MGASQRTTRTGVKFLKAVVITTMFFVGSTIAASARDASPVFSSTGPDASVYGEALGYQVARPLGKQSNMRGATPEGIVTAALSAAFGKRLCFRDRSFITSLAFIAKILGGGFEGCASIVMMRRGRANSVRIRDVPGSLRGRGLACCTVVYASPR
jgi:hypothetical protein